MTTQDKTTAIYVRTGVHSRSTGQSLAAQEQACRSYASALGWHLGEVFTDRAIAGTQRDRPGMGRLLAAVHDGAIERVVIARPDRLSRSHADIKAILHEMEARGAWSASPWRSPRTCGACRRIAQRSWTISLVEGQGAMKGGRL